MIMMLKFIFQKQTAIIQHHFSANYHGGALQFLEDYESAYMNIAHIMKHNKTFSTCHTGQDLHTDHGKQQTFTTNFSVLGCTVTLIENVASQTTTWDAMVNEL